MTEFNESYLWTELPLVSEESTLALKDDNNQNLRGWFRGEAAIEGEWIIFNRERCEKYSLHEAKELVFDLAALPRPLRPKAALAFVEKYGLLHYNGNGPEYRERFTDWEVVAHRFQTLLTGYSRWSSLEEFGTYKVFAHLLNQGLRTVHLQVTPELEMARPGHLVIDIQARNLVGLAYYQIARLIQTEQPIGLCGECSRYFAVTDKRMRFCSPRCAGTSRTRRFKEKKKELGNS